MMTSPFSCRGHYFPSSSRDTETLVFSISDSVSLCGNCALMLNFACPNELLSLRKSPQWGGKGRGPAGNQECEGVHTLNRL